MTKLTQIMQFLVLLPLIWMKTLTEDKSIEDIAQFAQLHDIGKINVAERRITDCFIGKLRF